VLRLVADAAAADSCAASRAVQQLLLALGQNLSSAHLADTPRRVAAALQEMLTPAPFTFTTRLWWVYLAGPASPMRVAVAVVPVLSARTRTRSLVVIWAVVAVCLPLWTLVAGLSV
jgi:hypothetical protein